MLWTEPAVALPEPSNATASGYRKAFSIVRFEGQVFTEIRRFIVVRNQGTHHSICVCVHRSCALHFL